MPVDAALGGLRPPGTREMNHPDVSSPYPAGAQLFFRTVTAISESTFAFKAAFVVCDLLIILALFDFLRRNGQGERCVVAYARHPLVAISLPFALHISTLL